MDLVGPFHLDFWPYVGLAIVLVWVVALTIPATSRSSGPYDWGGAVEKLFHVVVALCLTVIVLAAYIALNAWLAA